MCSAGWKHHVDVRLISHLSITRDWRDANDVSCCCKAQRHGNSLLFQKHLVVVFVMATSNIQMTHMTITKMINMIVFWSVTSMVKAIETTWLMLENDCWN